MINDQLQVSAYWGARQESAEQCAERAALFLGELRNIAALFSSWYLKSQTRKNAEEHPVVIDRDHLVRLFLAGVNRRDIDRSPITELGFSLGAWAGTADGVSATLRVTCGSYSKHIENVCLLDVTKGHDVSAEHVPQIVDAALRAWNPDGIEVNSKRVYPRA